MRAKLNSGLQIKQKFACFFTSFMNYELILCLRVFNRKRDWEGG